MISCNNQNHRNNFNKKQPLQQNNLTSSPFGYIFIFTLIDFQNNMQNFNNKRMLIYTTNLSKNHSFDPKKSWPNKIIQHSYLMRNLNLDLIFQVKSVCKSFTQFTNYNNSHDIKEFFFETPLIYSVMMLI